MRTQKQWLEFKKEMENEASKRGYKYLPKKYNIISVCESLGRRAGLSPWILEPKVRQVSRNPTKAYRIIMDKAEGNGGKIFGWYHTGEFVDPYKEGSK